MRLPLFAVLLVFLFSLDSYAQCLNDQVMVTVVINEDNYPQEISWTLIDDASNLIMSGDNLGDEICVPAELCLIFTINDSYGDGICCSYGLGSFEILIDGELITSGGDFDYIDTRSVNCPPGYTCDEAIEITEGNHTATDGNGWYIYTPTLNGSYALTTCDQGNTCDTKIWIYEYCNMGLFSEDNAGTIYYDNDEGGCGSQAQLNVALLEAGVTYWIRIGDDVDDCDGQDIAWSLSYNGPISGCMDVDACNYNPIAELDDSSCIYPGDPACPDGPDLVIIESAISNSLQLTTINASDGNCYIPEGCLNGYGTRDILRFTTHIKNIGNQDYYIGNPSDNPGQFDTENCHNHTHYVGYAEYLLYGLDGVEIPIGFKNGFCVLDLECSDGGTAQYGCSNMGISAQCGDIYSSGLSCQWIDITDTPDGIYTMVVRTNWDQDPDALGRHELDYDNNWGQICIEIDRGSGSLIVNEVGDCDPYIDCAGNIYGSAQPDCTGTCNGSTLSGDVNGDLETTMADAMDYASGIADEDFAYWTCYDLDNDGEITVTDAAAMTHCLIAAENHDHEPGEVHTEPECEFPVNVITNIFDNVDFTISNIDMNGGFFEVSMLNPLTRILAYEMKFEGVNISSAENLVDDGSYPITPLVGNNGSHIVGISYEDSSIMKQTDFTPILRLYFTGTPTSICLTEVVDVVNEIYENAVPNIIEGCGSCEFDLNGDGQVNIEDFIIFNSQFGQACDCQADFNGDGFVGIADFVEFNSAFGTGCLQLAEGPVEGIVLIDIIRTTPGLTIDSQLQKLIDDFSADHHMLLYPNPNKGSSVRMSLSGDAIALLTSVHAQVTDIQGKLLFNDKLPLSGGLVDWNFDGDLPGGSYIIEVNAGGIILRDKLVVLR